MFDYLDVRLQFQHREHAPGSGVKLLPCCLILRCHLLQLVEEIIHATGLKLYPCAKETRHLTQSRVIGPNYRQAGLGGLEEDTAQGLTHARDGQQIERCEFRSDISPVATELNHLLQSTRLHQPANSLAFRFIGDAEMEIRRA